MNMKRSACFGAVIITVVALLSSSCRKLEHDITNPDCTESILQFVDNGYAGQFKKIWQGIDVGYVFWNWDTTDWDAVYTTYLPVFESADARVCNGQVGMSEEEYETTWKSILSPLMDNHMNVSLTRPDIGGKIFHFAPSKRRLQRSDYHRRFTKKEHLSSLYSMIDDHRLDAVMDTVTVKTSQGNDGYLVNGIINGNIAYLYISSFMIYTPDSSSADTIARSFVLNWLGNTFNENLAGAILDTRNNTGGLGHWQQFLGQFFCEEEFIPYYKMVKSDVGRYDYAAPVNQVIKPNAGHRLMSDDCPLVCLFDLNSASNGEEIPWMFSYLPGYVGIGERTLGAMGGLVDNQYSTFYSGSFGDQSLGSKDTFTSSDKCSYSCSMSTFAHVDSKTGICPEGTGMIPQIEVLLDTTAMFSGNGDNQLLEAVKYIKNLKNRQ